MLGRGRLARHVATATDLEAALAGVLRAENAYFALLWEKLSRAQRA